MRVLNKEVTKDIAGAGGRGFGLPVFPGSFTITNAGGTYTQTFAGGVFTSTTTGVPFGFGGFGFGFGFGGGSRGGRSHW